MLLLFKGVLCYVTGLSPQQVKEQLRTLPRSMTPDRIRALLAATIWASQGAAQRQEALFAKRFAHHAKLPCGAILAAAMGAGGSPHPDVSRADAAAHSLAAHWIFSIDSSAGSLRSCVESEGFSLVRRVCPAYLLAASEEDHGGREGGAGAGRGDAGDADTEEGGRACKRRRRGGAGWRITKK